MRRYVTVRVTEEHIRKGRRHRFNGRHCPLARAVIAAGYPEARVGTHEWYPSGSAEAPASVPPKARAFIHAVDFGKPVKPATFRLPLSGNAT